MELALRRARLTALPLPLKKTRSSTRKRARLQQPKTDGQRTRWNTLWICGRPIYRGWRANNQGNSQRFIKRKQNASAMARGQQSNSQKTNLKPEVKGAWLNSATYGVKPAYRPYKISWRMAISAKLVSNVNLQNVCLLSLGSCVKSVEFCFAESFKFVQQQIHSFYLTRIQMFTLSRCNAWSKVCWKYNI